MGLLNWFDNKLNEKLMDACDKELVLLRSVIGDRKKLSEQFLEFFFEFKNKIYELSTFDPFTQRNIGQTITFNIENMYPDRRSDVSDKMIKHGAEVASGNIMASSAIKMLATWMKLVEIRLLSNKTSYRAHNLLCSYENEIMRMLEVVK